MSPPPTILFAGGGTGGHIFPSLAILERLREQSPDLQPLFAVSSRPLDAQILDPLNLTHVAIPVQPWTSNPLRWPAFFTAWKSSVAILTNLIREKSVAAVVATGGYVSAPAVQAAKQTGIPSALVNLDAVPGKANRRMATKATKIFTVYETNLLPTGRNKGIEKVGMPLRRSAIGPADQSLARRKLNLHPHRDVLLITGASQGAQSLNRMMIELVSQTQVRKAFRGSTAADPATNPAPDNPSSPSSAWQILHLSGPNDAEKLRDAYERAQIPALVLPFCEHMGLAWASASIAVSRAGAGSVAEAAANAVPTIFFPYPYHKDQHQKFNALPFTAPGAALLMADLIDPSSNARQLALRLIHLMANTTRRYQMADLLRKLQPPDSASAIATWINSCLNDPRQNLNEPRP